MTFDFADTLLSALLAGAGYIIGFGTKHTEDLASMLITIVAIGLFILCTANVIHNAVCWVRETLSKLRMMHT